MTVKELEEKFIGKEVIIRTISAGVFFGVLKKREGDEALLLNARRLWYWDGAASLSELAMNGVKRPENCKFPRTVDEIILREVIEVIPASKHAIENINEVPVWQA